MEISALTIVALSFVAFLAGFIDSVAGGGGLLMVPAYLLAGLPPHVTLGTNKFVSSFGTSMAVYNFVRKGKTSLKIILCGVLFVLCGAFIGSKTVLLVNQDLLGKMIVFLLPVGVVATLYPKKKLAHAHNLVKTDFYLKIPLIGLIVGFYDGFFGPGTGSFLALSFYVFLRLNLIEATANAKVFNLISNLGALTAFVIGGKVFYALGIPLAIASMLGNYTGSHLAIKKGEKFIKLFLVIVLAILFVTLVWKFL